MSELFQLIQKKFVINANRVGQFLILATDQSKTKLVQKFEDGPADLIRSAIVFLHATFEDALRTVAEKRLPESDFTKSTFGNTDRRVREILPRLNLVVSEFEDLFPHIDAIMKRRHRIVHRADLDDGTATPKTLTLGDQIELDLAIGAVCVFVSRLLSRLEAESLVNSEEHGQFVAWADGQWQQAREREREYKEYLASNATTPGGSSQS